MEPAKEQRCQDSEALALPMPSEDPSLVRLCLHLLCADTTAQPSPVFNAAEASQYFNLGAEK